MSNLPALAKQDHFCHISLDWSVFLAGLCPTSHLVPFLQSLRLKKLHGQVALQVWGKTCFFDFGLNGQFKVLCLSPLRLYSQCDLILWEQWGGHPSPLGKVRIDWEGSRSLSARATQRPPQTVCIHTPILISYSLNVLKALSQSCAGGYWVPLECIKVKRLTLGDICS